MKQLKNLGVIALTAAGLFVHSVAYSQDPSADTKTATVTGTTTAATSVTTPVAKTATATPTATPTTTPTAIPTNAPAAVATAPTVRDIKEGTRLVSKDQVKEVFPEATKIEEYTYVPKQWGGISLMGLISRLMGDRANRDYESIDTKRYLYRAFKDSQVLGIAHGSTTELQSNPFDVFVYYDSTSKIKDLRLQRLPTETVAKLTQGGYLQQFVDRDTNDFSVNIGRKGRVKDWGEFARSQKRPADSNLRPVWEKIVRSVRFNAAFVEVAYFISQHPSESTADNSASGR